MNLIPDLARTLAWVGCRVLIGLGTTALNAQNLSLAEVQVEPQAQIQAQIQAQPQALTQAQAKALAQTQPQSSPQGLAQTHPQSPPQAQAQAHPEAHAHPQAQVQARGQAEVPASPLPQPGPKDTCPVCGMFVAKYPHWVATVVYRDGHAHHFDGAKDLFKYLFDLPKWAPGHQAKDMVTIAVTEYYDLKRIPAREAWFVIGSDVPGPMGHEMVPLATAAEAQEFMRDHGGKRLLRFDEVTPDLPTKLDEGRFD